MKWNRNEITILDLYQKYQSFELILKPFFQRNLVWKESAKSSFIETILLGMPISEIYLLEEDGVLSVIDGQQRLSTIFHFMNEEFALNDKVEFPGLIYSNLIEDQKDKFDSYKMSYINIFNTTKAEVIDMYSRINQYTVNLNDQELRKATFSDSDFLKLAEDLSEEAFFENAKFFTPRKRQRMNDVEFISELQCILFDDIQDKKNTLDEFYELYTTIDSIEERKEDFKKILTKIERLFVHENLNSYFIDSKYDGTEGDSNLGSTRFKQFADFYSLFAAVKKIQEVSLSDSQIEKILNILIFLDEMIEPESDIELFREYAIKCVSQGNTKQSREFRRNILDSVLLLAIEDTHNKITEKIQTQLFDTYGLEVNLLNFSVNDTLSAIDEYYENQED